MWGSFIILWRGQIYLKVFLFLCEVKNRVIKNDLMTYANSLSFKLILAIFPFIISLLTLVGFFNLSADKFVLGIIHYIPKGVDKMFIEFFGEIMETKRVSLFSSSLFIAIYSASAGFYTMIKGICKSYDVNIGKTFFIKKLFSIVLVILFIITIIATFYVIIFGDIINELLVKFRIVNYIPPFLTGLLMLVIYGAVLFVFLICLYKFSIGVKTKIKTFLPGVFFTVGAWLIISKLFNLYVNNFSRYSVIYGSLGAIFIFALWLFLLSSVILIGAQLNAVYNDKEFINRLFS